ncbi:MAG: serine/threonine protein kinase [Myxococcota bacterium]|nr:serine/threonine protein kinase [Myxococcota bacterium]
MRDRFGSFELERRIGAGGMAETFVAVRRGYGDIEQRVCLKRILPEWQRDADVVRMFLEEGRVAARLRHSTIVQVIEAGEHDGVPFLALELIDGVDLRALLVDVRRLPPTLLATIALDLATALEVAHRAGVLHRDVSPANVLVSLAGEIKLADFGIARASDRERRTELGMARGKAAYLSPEYVATGNATPASDLFALGVTLFEAATGARPFAARTELASLERARLGDHTPITVLAPDIAPALATAIERLLTSAPAARFPSADALFDELAHLAPPPSMRRAVGALVSEVRARRDERLRANALSP